VYVIGTVHASVLVLFLCMPLGLFMGLVGTVHVHVIGTVYGHGVRALFNMSSDMGH
jgi:hypothetical protein